MSGSRRVRVFLNANSGGADVSAGKLDKAFADFGWECEVTPVVAGMDWKGISQRDGLAVVWVAAGGDGTVSAVSAACAGSGRLMGVLPVGTLNHFARDMKIPLALEDAIAVVVQGHCCKVDAAEANGLIFVNNSSLGMYPAMVLDRDRMRKDGGPKWWAMVKASARAFVRFRCLEVEFEVEGKVRHCRTAMLFVGNNRYEMEGGRIGQRERLNEGVLSVALVAGTTRVGLLKVLAGALLGRVGQVGELEEFAVKRFKVKARGSRRLRVSFDGEVKRLAGPLEYKVLPGALRLIAPVGEAQ